MFKTKDWRLSDLFRTDGTDSVFSANKSIHKHVQSTSQGDMGEGTPLLPMCTQGTFLIQIDAIVPFLPDRDMTMDVHLLDPSLLWYMCIKSPMTFFERLYSTEVVNTYSSMFVLLFCHIKSLEDKHTLGQEIETFL